MRSRCGGREEKHPTDIMENSKPACSQPHEHITQLPTLSWVPISHLESVHESGELKAVTLHRFPINGEGLLPAQHQLCRQHAIPLTASLGTESCRKRKQLKIQALQSTVVTAATWESCREGSPVLSCLLRGQWQSWVCTGVPVRRHLPKPEKVPEKRDLTGWWLI